MQICQQRKLTLKLAITQTKKQTITKIIIQCFWQGSQITNECYDKLK